MTQSPQPSDSDPTQEYQIGKEYALQRLSRRECSSEDLRRKIVQRGISPETSEQIVKEMIRLSLVSDDRYARMLIRQQANSTKGPRFIRQKLKEQGIDLACSEISEISSSLSDKSEVETARKFVERRYPQFLEDKKVANRACQALQRRGFSFDTVRAALIKPED